MFISVVLVASSSIFSVGKSKLAVVLYFIPDSVSIIISKDTFAFISSKLTPVFVSNVPSWEICSSSLEIYVLMLALQNLIITVPPWFEIYRLFILPSLLPVYINSFSILYLSSFLKSPVSAGLYKLSVPFAGAFSIWTLLIVTFFIASCFFPFFSIVI